MSPSVREHTRIAPARCLITLTLILVSITVAMMMAADGEQPAEAAVFRLHGTVATAPAWLGADAVVLLDAGREYRLVSVDISTGTRVSVGTIPRRYGYVELATAGPLVAMQGFEVGCPAEGERCKYKDYEVEADDVLAGSANANLQCLAGFRAGACGQRSYCQAFAPVLASGTSVAFHLCDASGQEQTIVANLSKPTVRVQPVESIALPLAMAGQWLVGLAPGWDNTQTGRTLVLVEQNLMSGANSMRVPLPQADYAPELDDEGQILPVAAVQEDGEVMYLTHIQEDIGPHRYIEDHFTLWHVSPSEPSPRAVATPPVDPEGRSPSELSGHQMTLADGQLALAEREPAPVYDPAIAVLQTDGTLLGRFADAALNGFDYNGATVLAAVTPCTESFLETWSPGSPAPSHPTPPCPAPHISHHVRLVRGRLQVAVNCPAEPPVGCAGVTMLFSSRRGREGGVEAETGSFDMLPGTIRTVAATLSRAERLWLARHPRALLKIEAKAIGGRPHIAGRVPLSEEAIAVRLH